MFKHLCLFTITLSQYWQNEKTQLNIATHKPTYLLVLQKASDVDREESLLKEIVNVTGQYKRTVKTSLGAERAI